MGSERHSGLGTRETGCELGCSLVWKFDMHIRDPFLEGSVARVTIVENKLGVPVDDLLMIVAGLFEFAEVNFGFRFVTGHSGSTVLYSIL